MSCDFDDNTSLGYCSDVPQLSPDSYYMNLLQPDPNCGTWIEFVEQPADYRYRYLKEKYHGHIVGVNSPATKKKDLCIFPKLKLHNHNGSAIVRVWLITTESNQPVAHFHKLARKPPKGVLNLEPHNFIASEQNNFEVTLDYLHIVHAVSNDSNDINIYRKKKAHIQSGIYDPPLTMASSTKEEKDEIKQIDKNQSVFYIQVFDENTHTKICEGISRKIKNLHNAETGALKIVNCSRTFGTCRGDDEVFIFVEKISKDVEIRFFKLDCNKKRIWEAPAIYGPHNIHHQLGIVFRTPKYEQDINKDSQVFFELHRKNDGAVSDPVSFTYKPHKDYRFHDTAKKRPHSPEIMSSEDAYLPAVLASYGLKRLKEETMSPDSTTIIPAHTNDIYENDQSIYQLDNASNLLNPFSGPDVSSLILDELNPNDLNIQINQSSMDEGLNGKRLIVESFEDFFSFASPSELTGFDGVSSTEDIKKKCTEFDSVSSTEDIKKSVEGNEREGNLTKNIEDKPISSNKVSGSEDNVFAAKKSENGYANKSLQSKKEPLISAIIEKKPIYEMVEILKNIEQIHAVDYEGNTALHLAATSSSEYLEILLENQYIDRSKRNLWGDDAVLCAARKGNIIALKLLLENNFESNVQNSRTGETPLHLAVSDGNYPIVELLLKHGADPLINNHSDQSAYEYSLNSATEIRQKINISMQRNMFKKRLMNNSSQPAKSAVEHDLVGKLNGLVVST